MVKKEWIDEHGTDSPWHSQSDGVCLRLIALRFFKTTSLLVSDSNYNSNFVFSTFNGDVKKLITVILEFQSCCMDINN